MSRRPFPLVVLFAPLLLAACTPPGPAPLDTVVAGDTGPVTVARIQGSGERSPLEGRQVEFEAVVVAPSSSSRRSFTVSDTPCTVIEPLGAT